MPRRVQESLSGARAVVTVQYATMSRDMKGKGTSLIDSMLLAAETAKKKEKKVQPRVADAEKESSSRSAHHSGGKPSKKAEDSCKNDAPGHRVNDNMAASASVNNQPSTPSTSTHYTRSANASAQGDKRHSNGQPKGPENSGLNNKAKNPDSDNNVLLEIRKEILSLSGVVKDLNHKYNDMKDYVESFEPYENEWGEHEPAEPGEVTDDVDDDVEVLEPPTKRQNTGHTMSGKCDMLDKLSKDVASQETTGTPITAALATAVNNIIANGISDEKLEEREKKYQRPENCENLVVTRINQPVWNSLEANTKTRDSKLQRIQERLVKGVTPLLGLADSLFKAANGETDMPPPETALEQALDALTILVSTHHELNMCRRVLVKPDLKDEYKPMCAPKNPVSQELFGEDLTKIMKDLKETSTAALKIHKQREGHYNYSNYRGRGRGGRRGGYQYGRGSGRGHFLRGGYQHPRKPPYQTGFRKRGRGRGQPPADG